MKDQAAKDEIADGDLRKLGSSEEWNRLKKTSSTLKEQRKAEATPATKL